MTSIAPPPKLLSLSESGPFATKPLEGSTTKIRLIELLPGAADTEVKCLFHVYPIAKYPGFTVLSYTWGPENPVHQISVHGQPVWIRENLWEALLELRCSSKDPGGVNLVTIPDTIPASSDDGHSGTISDTTPAEVKVGGWRKAVSWSRERFKPTRRLSSSKPFHNLEKTTSSTTTPPMTTITSSTSGQTKPVLYWVDQICVNQDDVKERNHQVALMKDIYSRASNVLVWLGVLKDMESERLAIVFMRRFNANHGGWPSIQVSAAYLDICNRPYWKRMWIVQEVMLARHVKLPIGPHEFLFDELVCSINDKSQYRPRGANTSAAHKLVWTKDVLEMHAAENQQLTLRMLVTLCSKQECHDSRDKLFGLFGFMSLNKDSKGTFHADYSMTQKEVCSMAIEIAYSQERLDTERLVDFGVEVRKVVIENQERVYAAKVEAAADRLDVFFSLGLQMKMDWQPTTIRNKTFAEKISVEFREYTAELSQILDRPQIWHEMLKYKPQWKSYWPGIILPDCGTLFDSVETTETSIACCDSPSVITMSKATCNLHCILDSSLTYSIKHAASYLVNISIDSLNQRHIKKSEQVCYLEPPFAILRRHFETADPKAWLKLLMSSENLRFQQWMRRLDRRSHEAFFNPRLKVRPRCNPHDQETHLMYLDELDKQYLEDCKQVVEPLLRRLNTLECSKNELDLSETGDFHYWKALLGAKGSMDEE